MDVEQHHVGSLLDDHGHSLADAAGVADDRQLVAELGANAGAKQMVIVHDHDARLGAHATELRSITSSTSVPSPGVL
jgi:hypothetical protein